MKTKVEVPAAFSVRDEHEFLAFQHLMHRLNPQLRVTEVAQGLHKEGGTTKFWGLVHEEGQPISRDLLLDVLREAGFDHEHNGATIKEVV